MHVTLTSTFIHLQSINSDISKEIIFYLYTFLYYKKNQIQKNVIHVVFFNIKIKIYIYFKKII